ncbi:MAG: caspase family protein [Planctomycetaceae bacterium]|nr:caspase family protein [Planctomycetaceae bacterium]
MNSVQRRFAVIVGVSQFATSEQISEIPYATNDACRLYSVLLDKCDFRKDDMHLLITSPPEGFDGRYQQPNRANILSALTCVAAEAGSNDLIFVYIASHGTEISSTPYLLVSDTRMNIVDNSAIDTREVNRILEASEAACVVRFFDACRTGFGIARTTRLLMPITFQEAVFYSAKGWATLSSCSSGEYSYDEHEFEQGIFSYYLCKGLSGDAANSSGNVTLEGLVEFVKGGVRGWCTGQSLKQTPHFVSDISGSLVLSIQSKPLVEVAEMSQLDSSPLTALANALREQLACTQQEARNLAFTTDAEHESFSKQTLSTVYEMVDNAEGESVIVPLVSRYTKREFHKVPHNAAGIFESKLLETKCKEEHIGNPDSTLIEFVGAEAVIPTTKLVISCARFSFFYWIWYLQVCDVPSLHKHFAPNPTYQTGFFTLKPSAAKSPQKIATVIRELFSRMTGPHLEWTKQLRAYIDHRLEPLRNQDGIIE